MVTVNAKITKAQIWRSFHGVGNVTELKKQGHTGIKHGAIVDNNGVIYNPSRYGGYDNSGYQNY